MSSNRPGPITVNKSLQSSNILNKNYIPLSLFLTKAKGKGKGKSKGKASTKSKPSFNSKRVSNVGKNYIPDELSFSILTKLPVKSLKRFRCVHKSWSILFENSDFMTTYANHFLSRHGDSHDYTTFLLTTHYPPAGSRLFNHRFHLLANNNTLKFNLPSPLQLSARHIYILGSTSVNGIFCFGLIDQDQNKVQYVLWNPAIEQEFRIIPPSLNEHEPRCNLNKFYHNYVFHGFGYDQVRDDFKLIHLLSFDPYDHARMPYCQSKTYFEIYSLKSNSWRWINMNKRIDLINWLFYPSSFLGCDVYLDGTCHWLVVNNSGEHTELTLLSFDLSNEALITTPIGQESYSPYTFGRRLAVLNGSIALLSSYQDHTVFCISILGELGVTESWIKLYVYGPLPSIQWAPLGFGKMGYMFFRKSDGELAYIDLSTEKIEDVHITGGNKEFVAVGLYKKSLLSTRGSNK